MSTRSFIGIQNSDGTVDAVYCHFDGYLPGVGADLIGSYDGEELARGLVQGGDMRSVGDPYLAYAGEEWEDIKPIQYDTLSAFAQKGFQIASFVYLFQDGAWSRVRENNTTCDLKELLGVQKTC